MSTVEWKPELDDEDDVVAPFAGGGGRMPDEDGDVDVEDAKVDAGWNGEGDDERELP